MRRRDCGKPGGVRGLRGRGVRNFRNVSVRSETSLHYLASSACPPLSPPPPGAAAPAPVPSDETSDQDQGPSQGPSQGLTSVDVCVWLAAVALLVMRDAKPRLSVSTFGSPVALPPHGPPHRKSKTQILGKPNPETKYKENIFRAHFESYSKTNFVAS